MDTALIKDFFDCCREAKKILELLPPLPQGLTPRHIQIIDTISQLEEKNGLVKISDISTALHVTRPSITRLVSELAAAGYAQKAGSATDGRVLDRCGAALPVLGGSILMLGSVSAMAWLTPDISNTLFAVLYTFFAFGQAASIPTVTLCAIRCLSADDSASGNAVINTLQPLSGALGTSICASIVAAAQNASAGAAGTQTGTAHALVLLAFLTCAILACSLYMLGGRRHKVLNGEAY